MRPNWQPIAALLAALLSGRSIAHSRRQFAATAGLHPHALAALTARAGTESVDQRPRASPTPAYPGDVAHSERVQRNERPDLRLTLSAQASATARDGCITIWATLSNVSAARTYNLGVLPGPTTSLDEGEFLYRIEVLDAKGRTAPPTAFAARVRRLPNTIVSQRIEHLGPGAHLKTRIPVARLYDMTLPGLYTVRAVLKADRTVTSNKLKITVR
jgi:hypothetical protein